MRRLLLASLSAALLVLAGCDQLGIESASAVAARREADGKAIGAGCRHAARSVEDCYANNKRSDKAAVFAGWKEMNDYMRENDIQAVPAEDDTRVAAVSGAHGAEPEPVAGKADTKTQAKSGDKSESKADAKASSKAAPKAPAKGADPR